MILPYKVGGRNAPRRGDPCGGPWVKDVVCMEGGRKGRPYAINTYSSSTLTVRGAVIS